MAALFYDKCKRWTEVLKCYELGRCPREFIAAYKTFDEATQTTLHAAYTSGLKKLAVHAEQSGDHDALIEVLVELNVHEVSE